MNKIIAFANQKGGVGKTTLCILFADYLAWKKKGVVLLDADDDQCTNESIEELAKFIRGHLAEIPENAQKQFERIYTKTTGKKMYGGFKD